MFKPRLSSQVLSFACLLLLSLSSYAKSSHLATDIKINYVNMAHAVYTDSLASAKHLQSKITQFLNEPTKSNLDKAKSAYKTARIAYQQSEIMRWDTDITLSSNTGESGISSVDGWEGQVNAWPLAEGLIDYTKDSSTNNIIASKAAITTDYLISQNGVDNNEANVATGIHAIEFLLWGQDLNGTSAGAGVRPATDYDLKNCTHNHCDRRATYLRVVTQLLVDDLMAMVAEWTPVASQTPGTLAYNFLHSDKALAYIIGSMKVMSDDELASARMGTALETNDPEEEHDCFSDLSHIAIYNNFQGIKNAFYGYYNTIQGKGIGDLLKQKDPSLYKKIDKLIASIEKKMSRIVAVAERDHNPLRFDQIIGLGAGNAEYDNANAASLELIQLGLEFNLAREALSLKELNVDGGGDGD
ncbi:MAG: hypothetical protein KTR20_11330 [Cellvibrionaceae bacterium]|nr:hypothetical protein [Cellvibrionaceae bacterium]